VWVRNGLLKTSLLKKIGIKRLNRIKLNNKPVCHIQSQYKILKQKKKCLAVENLRAVNFTSLIIRPFFFNILITKKKDSLPPSTTFSTPNPCITLLD
jgi:hypothetical protein